MILAPVTLLLHQLSHEDQVALLQKIDVGNSSRGSLSGKERRSERQDEGQENELFRKKHGLSSYTKKESTEATSTHPALYKITWNRGKCFVRR
jgi:hypothetical protein